GTLQRLLRHVPVKPYILTEKQNNTYLFTTWRLPLFMPRDTGQLGFVRGGTTRLPVVAPLARTAAAVGFAGFALACRRSARLPPRVGPGGWCGLPAARRLGLPWLGGLGCASLPSRFTGFGRRPCLACRR